MRVTFILLRRGYVRNFASCIEGLLAKGHQVHLGFDMPDHSPTGIEERLAERYPGLTWDGAPQRHDKWTSLLFFLRGMIDLIRYYHPDYRDAPVLQQRLSKKSRRYIGPFGKVLDRIFFFRSAWMVRTTIQFLNWIQFKLPVCEEIRTYLQEKNPDVVIVTPLVNIASEQVDDIETANHLGIPAIAAIASWDNLTNKGLLRCRPDRVLVWNRPQKHEAEIYHYIPSERIRVTGAHTFDRWLGRKPKRTREEFLAHVGLEGCRDYIAFMCSSNFISRHDEAEHVRNWIAAIRDSRNERVRNAGVLVRPHFQNAGQWEDEDFSDLEQAVIFPRGGANPVDAASAEDFFDTLFFASAVVGVNTTAMIEAGLIGRPVMSLETDRFRGTQSGSLHFRHLREGGLLKYSTTMEEHLVQLSEALDNPPPPDANRAFVDYFIRSPEPDLSATEMMVREIEAAALLNKTPIKPGLSDRLVRILFLPAARILSDIKRAKEEKRLRKTTSALPESVETGTARRLPGKAPKSKLRRHRNAVAKRMTRLARNRRIPGN